jgi:hypothetical protein
MSLDLWMSESLLLIVPLNLFGYHGDFYILKPCQYLSTLEYFLNPPIVGGVTS